MYFWLNFCGEELPLITLLDSDYCPLELSSQCFTLAFLKCISILATCREYRTEPFIQSAGVRCSHSNAYI